MPRPMQQYTQPRVYCRGCNSYPIPIISTCLIFPHLNMSGFTESALHNNKLQLNTVIAKISNN